MDPLSILAIVFIATIIDLIFGELPTQIHPVVFIGRIIEIFKKLKEKYSIIDKRIAGAFLTIFLITY
jgi:adenosylcobinamide-phosphate synthase